MKLEGVFPALQDDRRRIAIAMAGDVLTRPLARFERGLAEWDVSVEHHEIDQVFQVLTVAEIGAGRALSLQNRLAMRMPYTKVAIDALRAAYEQVIRERYGVRKKVVILDADNTLWGGIVGEDGLEGIAIDKQYPGTVYRRFQGQLLDLAHTGVLLALVTKNNPADVEATFQRRDMPLKLEHFSSNHVNWEPKSDNIVRVSEELNLGLDSVIFIDDNPFELEQVKAALPEVEVYRFEVQWADTALGLLASIPGLKTWSVTSEDLQKAAHYRDER